MIAFHPCAENVLASTSLDYSVKIWNVETGKDEITLQHNDFVTSISFNYNGSLLATCARDKKLRIWDIRSGKIISEGSGTPEPNHRGLLGLEIPIELLQLGFLGFRIVKLVFGMLRILTKVQSMDFGKLIRRPVF